MNTISRGLCSGAIFALAVIAAPAQTICPGSVAQIISPTPGSTLPAGSVTFAWCHANGDYFLDIESVPGAHEIFYAFLNVESITLGPACNTPNAISPTTQCIVPNGETIYVTLWTNTAQSGRKNYVAAPTVTFTAANSTPMPVATTTTVDNKTATAANTDQNIILTATVAGGTINQGAVTFQVMDGATKIGAAVTSATLTTGSASVVYLLPGGTAAKTYTIQAAYSGGTNFQPSSGNGSLTVNAPAPGAASTTTTVSAQTVAFSGAGQNVSLAATVTAASPVNEGTVTFQVRDAAANVGSAVTSAPLTNGAASVTYALPAGLAANNYTIQAAYSGGTNFLPSSGAGTLTVSAAPPSSGGLRFVPVTPCRVADTRDPAGPFGGPRPEGNTFRTYSIPSSACGIPASAAAYSLNVTVVPAGSLGYLTLFPTGQVQPFVSTLNSFDGRIKANAAIVPAGSSGSVSVFVTDPTDVILDIDGYFIPASGNSTLSFYPVTPCRVADTRNATGPFGGPRMSGSEVRTFGLPQSGCNLPPNARAYSLNFTVVPPGPLSYLTTWPAGQNQPFVSTLNSFNGAVVANAAIVPAGTNGAISVYVTNPTDVVIDVNGYFAAPGFSGALSFYTVNPCRVSDSRNAAGTFGGPSMSAGQTRAYPVPSSACGIPATAQAYSFNATVVPAASLGYLTLWPVGGNQPFVSTLNSFDGSVTSNAAIAPAGASGAINAYVTNATDLILDINGYFAP